MKNLLKKFRNALLKLGRPTPDLIFGVHHPLGLTLRSTKQFFLHCHYYSARPISFLNDLNNILLQFALFPKDVFVKTLLSGSPIFDENDNQKIFETSIRYILDSKRFSGGL